MAKQKMDTGVITLSNAIGMEITPYVSNDGVLELGDTTYDITEIVADTVSITPDDNEVNTVDAEFRDTPLFENVTLGQVQFAATCTDFQNDMMKAIFGWTEHTEYKSVSVSGFTTKDDYVGYYILVSTVYTLVTNANKSTLSITPGTTEAYKAVSSVLAPLNYEELYAAIVVRFANRHVVLPKVKMNSKAVLATLKTGYGEGQLAGTAYAGYVNFDAAAATATKANTKQTTWGFIPASSGEATMDYRFLASEPAS